MMETETVAVWEVEIWLRLRLNPFNVLEARTARARPERTRVWAIDMEREIDRVAEPVRTYLLLRAGGHTHPEVAKIMHVSLRTVYRWQHDYFRIDDGKQCAAANN